MTIAVLELQDIRVDTILHIPVGLIDPNTVQPAGRTTPTAVRELLKNVAAGRDLTPILVVPNPQRKGRYIIVDGHRRWTVATLLGFKTVKVTICTDVGTPEELFVIHNKSMRSMKGPDWFESWARGVESGKPVFAALPAAQRNDITRIVEWTSKEEAIALAMDGYSPNIANTVCRILLATAVNLGSGKKLKNFEGGQVLRWLVKHNQQNAANAVINSMGKSKTSAADLNRLMKCIKNDKPLPED